MTNFALTLGLLTFGDEAVDPALHAVSSAPSDTFTWKLLATVVVVALATFLLTRNGRGAKV